MIRFISSIVTWIILWLTVGLAFGVLNHGHAWQVLPMFGAFFGLIGGLCFAIIVQVAVGFDNFKDSSQGILYGLAATLLFVPTYISGS
ncbi:hypothetical protein [Lacimicrobium sp. SS2-24]|uniref:hypothetical protein n=1 Tax=Lacimicrobium sp. SS2-24 TaxID=2005569 RepID=UPI000B4B12CF|nr:hypothetical protein [Lacimicrobium sp. SS2-24]